MELTEDYDLFYITSAGFTNGQWEYYWKNIDLIKNELSRNLVIDFGVTKKLPFYDSSSFKKLKRLRIILHYLSENNAFKFIEDNFKDSDYHIAIVYLPVSLIYRFAGYYKVEEKVFNNLIFFNDTLIEQFLEVGTKPSEKLIENYYCKLLYNNSNSLSSFNSGIHDEINLKTFQKLLEHSSSNQIVNFINKFIYENNYYNLKILEPIMETYKWKNNSRYNYHMLYKHCKEYKLQGVITLMYKYYEPSGIIDRLYYFIF